MIRKIKKFNNFNSKSSKIYENNETDEINKITTKLDELGIEVYVDTSNLVVVGFELNTYTDGGVNMVLYIDMEDDEITYKKFCEVLKSRIESIDIDEEINIHRQDDRYKRAFSLRESIEDFESYKENMMEIVNKLCR